MKNRNKKPKKKFERKEKTEIKIRKERKKPK